MVPYLEGLHTCFKQLLRALKSTEHVSENLKILALALKTKEFIYSHKNYSPSIFEGKNWMVLE